MASSKFRLGTKTAASSSSSLSVTTRSVVAAARRRRSGRVPANVATSPGSRSNGNTNGGGGGGGHNGDWQSRLLATSLQSSSSPSPSPPLPPSSRSPRRPTRRSSPEGQHQDPPTTTTDDVGRPIPVTPEPGLGPALDYKDVDSDNEDNDTDKETVPKEPALTINRARRTRKVSSTLPKIGKRKRNSNGADTAAASGTTTTRRTPTPPTAFVPPPDWDDIYGLVQELRRDRTAPCDLHGAEALPESGLREGDPKTYRFQVLVALMLSSQTKDAMVAQAMANLQRHGLTVDNLRCHTSQETLNGMIKMVGFHNTKTMHLIRVVEILQERYNGDIPPTAADMIRDLPGVGPKMAHLVESICYPDQPPSGIGIDTHMHRVLPQIGLVPKGLRNPEQTRRQLESWLPRDRWRDANLLWVGFGQEVQQEKAKILQKARTCSRPREALRLLQRVGIDPYKDGPKLFGWTTQEIDDVLSSSDDQDGR